MSKETKPKLDIDGQIGHLVSKGVKFEKITKEEAREYLLAHNNYFKLRAYRKNFPKHHAGENKGKYIDLDFAMLKDLSVIDMQLRYTLIHLALDIEHFAKVKLIKMVTDSEDDGYTIVENYKRFLLKKETKAVTERSGLFPYKRLMNELNRSEFSPYCRDLLRSYKDECPIWVFVEIISFGTFISFYKFCADELASKRMQDEFYLLLTVKAIRNAAAHNNCIINDLNGKDNKIRPNDRMVQALSTGFSRNEKRNRLKNERICQIVTLLFTHSAIVTSQSARQRRGESLKLLIDRMYKNIDLYAKNDTILTNFSFLKRVVDLFYF